MCSCVFHSVWCMPKSVPLSLPRLVHMLGKGDAFRWSHRLANVNRCSLKFMPCHYRFCLFPSVHQSVHPGVRSCLSVCRSVCPSVSQCVTLFDLLRVSSGEINTNSAKLVKPVTRAGAQRPMRQVDSCFLLYRLNNPSRR